MVEEYPITKPENHFFVGLDIGQARDYTAFVVLESVSGERSDAASGQPREYRIRHCECLPLNTSYNDVIERVRKLLKQFGAARVPITLIVDSTGVGASTVRKASRRLRRCLSFPDSTELGLAFLRLQFANMSVVRRQLRVERKPKGNG